MAMHRAVFLDRDGTINEESGYLHKIEDCRFIPDAIAAIARLKAAGFLVVIVTNQSGIARGYYTEDDLLRLHQYMEIEIVNGGGRVDGWYFCPHHPDFSDDCDCRKPFPGMLRTAADELEIDLASSWMIGDKIADIEAGIAAGCKAALVRTGYGRREEALLPAQLPVFDDICSAVEYITNPDSKR
ncbi:MAG: D-glycero-beta-D-manno-heptose 1,7-bisphosphate 7-phosphatase [Geobacteraceae bacterium]|nr:D-glycero-beta-D-manno-heptose 1,7-bisphosphate 7-phosphatase [Geobacteraceae bacterium]